MIFAGMIIETEFLLRSKQCRMNNRHGYVRNLNNYEREARSLKILSCFNKIPMTSAILVQRSYQLCCEATNGE